jgi:Na+-transporting methylmalonyl-CoA/oxaloacetate decarboxylase gamma subunit
LDHALITALAIAAIGMTLLFLALFLFYGMLSVLTATVRDKPSTSAQPMREEEGEEKAKEAALRAAAIAVALARAEAEQGSSRPMAPVPAQAPTGRVSPWWALYHQRQVSTHQTTRRSP